MAPLIVEREIKYDEAISEWILAQEDLDLLELKRSYFHPIPEEMMPSETGFKITQKIPEENEKKKKMK